MINSQPSTEGIKERELKNEVIKLVLGTALFVASLIMCHLWYDYKLLLILVVFGWMNNIQQSKRR